MTLVLEPELSSAKRAPTATSLVLLCAALYALIVIWTLIFRHSGDGDAAPHFLTARGAWQSPSDILYAWSRPLHKLLIMLPAAWGHLQTRLFCGLITSALVWQTVRLAQDLKIDHAYLAGPLLLFQAAVFALASDTMTELPTALQVILAIRAWRARRLLISCLLIAFVPLMRPEGFGFIGLWGLMLLWTRDLGSWRRRVFLCVSLASGMAAWMAACKALTGDWLFFRQNFWPLDSSPIYGRGHIWHYVVNFPLYAGPVLTVLLLAGIRPSLRREMWLPWAWWLLLFVGHSVLFTGGWLGSVGVMRILAVSSPATALICLYGWNRLIEPRAARSRRPMIWRTVAMGVVALMTIAQYLAEPNRHHTFPIDKTAAYIRQERLLDASPAFFFGDEAVLASLGCPPYPRGCVKPVFGRPDQLALLYSLPQGAIGVWDNQQAVGWHSVRIEELQEHGFSTLFEARQKSIDILAHFFLGHPLVLEQRFVVLRKDTPATRPADVGLE